MATEFISPILEAVIKADQVKTGAIASFTYKQLLNCLTSFLEMQDKKVHIIRNYDVTALLLNLVSRHEIIFEDIDLYK